MDRHRLEILLVKTCSQDPSHPLVPYALLLVQNRETIFPTPLLRKATRVSGKVWCSLQSPQFSDFLITSYNYFRTPGKTQEKP